MSDSSSLRAILYATGANFGIFLTKIAAAVVTGSSAMFAEAIHSLADGGNQALLLRGIREAKRPPDSQHPLGDGRVAYSTTSLFAIRSTTGGPPRPTCLHCMSVFRRHETETTDPAKAVTLSAVWPIFTVC